MNPYDFVPTDFGANPVRRAPLTHEKFQGKAGRIECRLTAETPIFIPESRERQEEFQDAPQNFITRNGVPIIPGSSLKGLLRNLVETVGNGCYLLFDEAYERRRFDYSGKLPQPFHKCTNAQLLCIACRMFGMLERRAVFQGNVSVSDALTASGRYSKHAPMYTKPLMGPKPRHKAFYLNDTQNHIAGRKFYFHSQQIRQDTRKTPYNQYICPLNPDSQFTFTVDFHNIQDDELAVLLYALALEPTMRHKIGLAKPVGLGSVKIEIATIELIDYQQRYRKQAAPQKLTGADCQTYVDSRIAAYTQGAQANTPTMQALRRIWNWNPEDDTQYAYPPQSWFKANSQTRLHELT